MGRKMPYVDSSWPPRSKDVGERSKPCKGTAGSAPTSSAPATTAGDPSMPSATPSPATPGCHPPQHDQLKNTPDWLHGEGGRELSRSLHLFLLAVRVSCRRPAWCASSCSRGLGALDSAGGRSSNRSCARYRHQQAALTDGR